MNNYERGEIKNFCWTLKQMKKGYRLANELFSSKDYPNYHIRLRTNKMYSYALNKCHFYYCIGEINFMSVVGILSETWKIFRE